MGNFEKSISRGSKVQGEGTRLEIRQKVNMRNLYMFRLKANQIHPIERFSVNFIIKLSIKIENAKPDNLSYQIS